MSDKELVKRLRWKAGAYAKEAADRIEALTAKHEELYGVFVFWRAEADKLREQLEAARADTKKAVKALLLARVHVANNEQGWSVGRASARSDLKIINATLAEIEGD